MSVLEMQLNGERMNVQFISNFIDGFHEAIWNLVKSLEAMLTADKGDKWNLPSCINIHM